METVNETSAVTASTQTLEQGQADRTEATAATEARLGHSDAVAARRAHAGPGAL